MLTVISPAKRLNPDAPIRADATMPAFQADANRLAAHGRQLSQAKLMSMMGISRDLAKLNAERFQEFRDDGAPESALPAVLTFAGDTYIGLDAASLDDDEMTYAQSHLRILSGLYGVLRPLDRIQPYRLEMGSRMKTRRGTTLYKYWGPHIARALREQAEEVGTNTLINCASTEYFSAVDQKALGLTVVTPVFLEERNGKATMVSFFAKKARGAMARFVIAHRLDSAEAIRDFDSGGYAFDPAQSTPERPVFVRPYPDA